MKNLLQQLNPNYNYQPISYHDSWISVDPIIGCQLNCLYCYMQMTNWTGVKSEYTYSIEQITDMLLKYKYFIPHKTVLCFGNQTDSFLKHNVIHTLRFLKLLEKRELTNPVVIVTKKLIPGHFIDEISNFNFVKPIFCLSYSGLPKSVEQGVNPEENRKNFRNLSQNNISVIHFWRPLLTINGTDKILQNILDYVTQYAIASVYNGLNLNPHLNSIYNKNPDLQIPEDLLEYFGEYIPANVEDRLKNLVEEKYPRYPLYKHTSCAISLALAIPDYNATVYRDPICKGSECPVWKRKICENAKSLPKQEDIENLLRMVGLKCKFIITNHAVEIFGKIDQEDYVFLLHNLNYPLVAKNLYYNRVLRGSIFRKDGERNIR